MGLSETVLLCAEAPPIELDGRQERFQDPLLIFSYEYENKPIVIFHREK